AIGLRQPQRIDVAFEVVDAEQRFAGRQRQPFGVVDADQQRADQPRPARDRDSVDAVVADAGVAYRLLPDDADRLDVRPRGGFREHAAVLRVNVDLRGDDVRDDGLAIQHNRRGGFVARTLDAEDIRHQTIPL